MPQENGVYRETGEWSIQGGVEASYSPSAEQKKLAETSVSCFIGSVNKHIHFGGISGGLLEGNNAIPQDAISSISGIWFTESGGLEHWASANTKKMTLQGISGARQALHLCF